MKIKVWGIVFPMELLKCKAVNTVIQNTVKSACTLSNCKPFPLVLLPRQGRLTRSFPLVVGMLLSPIGMTYESFRELPVRAIADTDFISWLRVT